MAGQRVYKVSEHEARRILYYRSQGWSIRNIATEFSRSFKAVERVLRLAVKEVENAKKAG